MTGRRAPMSQFSPTVLTSRDAIIHKLIVAGMLSSSSRPCCLSPGLRKRRDNCCSSGTTCFPVQVDRLHCEVDELQHFCDGSIQMGVVSFLHQTGLDMS